MKLSLFASLVLVSFGVEIVAEESNNDFVSLPLIPNHKQQNRRLVEEEPSRSRRRAAAAEALQVGALYQGYGTHYVDLWVGTPPQRQTLIVDTGSGVSAFPCNGCHECGVGHHIDKFYDFDASSSFKKLKCTECQRGRCAGDICQIGMSYQEGSSWHAFEARDMVYIGGPHDHGLEKDNGGKSDLDPDHAKAFAFEMSFGCQTHLTGLFKTQLADGIMGMDNANSAFWFQMHASKKLPSRAFALCFTRQPTALKTGTESGALTLGGVDTRLHSSSMVYTSVQGSGFFKVQLRAIMLREGKGGLSAQSADDSAKVLQLNIPQNELRSVIVDSGTTDTYFTRRIAPEFRKAYKELTHQDYHNNGVTLTQEQLEALPTILIQMSGDVEGNKKLSKDPNKMVGLAGDLDKDNPYDVILAIPPTHYMEYDPKQKKYVARFYVDESGGGVIGANAIMGHDVFFDIDTKRIGWAESDCDYTKLVTDNGFSFGLDTKAPKQVEKKKDDKEEKKKDDKEEKKKDEEELETTKKDKAAQIAATFSPVLEACSDWTCRGVVIGSLVTFMLMGILVGRACGRRDSRGAYHTAEVEVPSMRDEEDEDDEGKAFVSQYRDHPDEEEDDHDTDLVDENGVEDLEKEGYYDDPAPMTNGYKHGVEMEPLKVV